MSLAQELSESLHSGFIDGQTVSLVEYQPRLLINDSKRGRKVLTCILNELRVCDEFYFSVAFITNSGVAVLIETLRELEKKRVKGKIVASQYQNFTQPRALKRLSRLTNVDLRIMTEGNFHAKGYIFRRGATYSLIVGSSNLTQNALTVNKEWNIKVSIAEAGALIKNILQEFNQTFKIATKVNETWIDEYEKIYKNERLKSSSNYDSNIILEVDSSEITNIKRISPNMMQIDALQSLERLRAEGKNKALLISATGTGKTYLSAFDAKKYNPKRLLFIIHRENIARAALRSYKTVFGSSKSMGVLSSNSKATNVDFIFSTIQTMSRDNTLNNFPRDYFDYIIIDEVHRSGAQTYRKIIDYFKPKFMLGMSATPERTDGYDIFKAFDYNIAYEIRLNKALEENMLTPFHYYGICDLEVNGNIIEDKSEFNNLVCEERVSNIIHYADYYGCDYGRIKGLIFCSRRDEAKQLSTEFNKRGYKTISLDGDSSEELREECINRLEQNEGDDALDYIFTVDIFNEGVDIPSINLVIMLRPTQSAIIFVQQLGRGLRKCLNKEYLTVIDFIGNYANNYLVPISLYGDSSYNKDNIRRLITSGSSYIPGASTVDFDQITKEKIFESLNINNLSRLQNLKKDYQLLKYKLGKIPDMYDFIEHASRDPYSYVEYSGSYYAFISSVEEPLRGKLTKIEEKRLKFYSKEICNAKRIEELILLKEIIKNNEISKDDLLNKIKEKYNYSLSEKTLISVLSCLNADFFKQQDQQKYMVENSVVYKDDKLIISNDLSKAISNGIFRKFLLDTLKCAIHKFDSDFSREKYYGGFILYQKYSRKDVCRILNWEKDESSTLYGYRIKYNTCPIFVTYNKAENISESIKYKDKFINSRQFSWMTKPNRKLNSVDVIQIGKYKETGLRIPLFIKKDDGEGTDFYYMGDIEPYEYKQSIQKNDAGKELPIVNIKFNMKIPVEDNLYNYFEAKIIDSEK